jgi:L-arabinose isomerase
MIKKIRKPRIGVLLITTPRFRNLGEGTERGLFRDRKEKEAHALTSRFDYADIVFPRIVYTREDIKRAMDQFINEKADMVFAHFMSWSDDYAWIRFLRDMPEIPVYFAGISREEPGFEDSLSEDRFVEFLSAGGLVGLLEGSGSASRFHRPMFRRRTGSMETILKDVKHFALAACIRSELRQTAFGLLPSYNEVMWSTYIDPYDLFMRVGPELRFLGVAELNEHIAAIEPKKNEEVMKNILNTYPVRGTIDEEKMSASVKASLALESIARAHEVELLVLNDIDPVLLRQVGLRPGFTPCPGTEDIMVVPEGDLGGGLACFILGKLTGQAVNYIEPFHVDNRNGTFAAGHAGPNDYTDPGGKTVLSTDTRFAKSGYKHAGAPFAWHVISPGEKTMVHISQCNGRFKMAVSIVDALPSAHFLAGYSHGVFKPRTPVEEFFTRLQNIGVTQHYGISAGDHREVLKDLAEILDFEFHSI